MSVIRILSPSSIGDQPVGVFLGIAALIILWKMNIEQIGKLIGYLLLAAMGVYFFIIYPEWKEERQHIRNGVHCVAPGELEKWERGFEYTPFDWQRRLHEAAKPVGPPCAAPTERTGLPVMTDPAAARRLPPGTHFLTPDGRELIAR